MRVRRGVYEGAGSHGILRVGASMTDVHTLYRALPEEWHFPALLGARGRSGALAPVTLSPVIPPFEGSRAPGDFERDLAAAARRHRPEAVMVARSDTALLSGEVPPQMSLAPDELTGRAPPLIRGDWESTARLEHEAAALALFELVRRFTDRRWNRTTVPSVNLFTSLVLDPRAAAEVAEVRRLLAALGVEVNAVVPLGATVEDIRRLPRAWANVVLDRAVGEPATLYLQDEFKLRRVSTPIIGTVGTGAMLRAVGDLCGLDELEVRRTVWTEVGRSAQLPWYSRITAPELLEGRRVGIFGDFTNALGLGYTFAHELGMEVVWAGTYLRHLRRDFLWRAGAFTDEAFVTDDPEEVAARAEESGLELLIGTRLEAAVAEELDLPFLPLCLPAAEHPLSPRPLTGYTGTNTLADALDDALRHHPAPRPTLRPETRSGLRNRSAPAASHDPPPEPEREPQNEAWSDPQPKPQREPQREARSEAPSELRGTASDGLPWTEDARRALERVPSFLRGHARRRAEEYARELEAPAVTREIVEAAS